MDDRADLHPRVLVVEDDHGYQRLLELSLKRMGCQCDFCFDGKTALDLISSTPYDLVLIDIHIPEVDGFMVAYKLREMECHLPLVAISAIDLEDIEQKAKAVGYDVFLHKPIEDDQIRQLLSLYVKNHNATK